MKNIRLVLVALLCLFIIPATTNAKETVDARLRTVKKLYVSGNNQAAEGARNELQKDSDREKGCLTAVSNAKEADAILEVASDTNSMGQGPGDFGAFGGRNWIASGTLTLASGDLVWSHSERFSDAPFRSGGKVAGKLLYVRLRTAVCEGR